MTYRYRAAPQTQWRPIRCLQEVCPRQILPYSLRQASKRSQVFSYSFCEVDFRCFIQIGDCEPEYLFSYTQAELVEVQFQECFIVERRLLFAECKQEIR